MPRRKTMRRIRECLRLYHESEMNQSQISRSLNLSRSTVGEYLSRLNTSSLTYEMSRSLSDSELQDRLYPAQRKGLGSAIRPEIDFSYIHKELGRSGVTLHLLWEEYKQEHPDGHQYSQFCWHYQQWKKALKVYMRQRHIGGERIFVDYSGKKPCIVNRFTGEIEEVELFVMCWGYSQYIYAEAQPSQKLKEWIRGHVHAFAFFGCVSKLVVPDNYKGAVAKAHRYDPDVNVTYQELAEHYGIGVLPARPRKPKDKAKVENSVLIVQRWILARLRNQVFHSIEELNQAIRKLLDEVNSRIMKKLGKSRKELFEEVDKPAARALPQTPYVLREWYTPTINLDYHIEIQKRYYSVPWNYYKKKVQVCVENNMLSVFYKEQRIAVHSVVDKEYTYSTCAEHMPPNHRAQYDWSYEMIMKKAREVGAATEKLVSRIIAKKLHPQQGFRPSLGVLRLGATYGADRLEAAARIAVQFDLTRVRQIADILRNGKDLPSEEVTGTVANDTNIRGQHYYKNSEETL